MFPEPRELLLIGCLIESIWTPRSKSNTLTPRTNSQTYWQRKVHTWWMESSFVFVQHQPFPFHQLSWSDVEKNTTRCKKERVTAKSKPVMNLASRYSARDPNVLASTASESPEKTKSESQVPLTSWNEQQPRTGGLVMGASSSDNSEWNIDDKWSSQEWKSGEMLGARTGETRRWQVCHWSWYGLWHRRRIEPFSEITIILAQGKWSIAKDIGTSSRRCNAWHRQTFFNLVNVYVFNIGSICIHGKELLRNFTLHQKIQERISLWNRCLTYLKSS